MSVAQLYNYKYLSDEYLKKAYPKNLENRQYFLSKHLYKISLFVETQEVKNNQVGTHLEEIKLSCMIEFSFILSSSSNKVNDHKIRFPSLP